MLPRCCILAGAILRGCITGRSLGSVISNFHMPTLLEACLQLGQITLVRLLSRPPTRLDFFQVYLRVKRLIVSPRESSLVGQRHEYREKRLQGGRS